MEKILEILQRERVKVEENIQWCQERKLDKMLSFYKGCLVELDLAIGLIENELEYAKRN